MALLAAVGGRGRWREVGVENMAGVYAAVGMGGRDWLFHSQRGGGFFRAIWAFHCALICLFCWYNCRYFTIYGRLNFKFNTYFYTSFPLSPILIVI